MPTQGDIVELNLGTPIGSKAGMLRPAVVVTAGRILRGEPTVIQVVPLTRTLRDSGAEIVVEPDRGTGLLAPSAAQCQHVRSVATSRCRSRVGSVGPVTLAQIRGVLALLLDID